MADSMGEWSIDSLQNRLIPILALLGITQASIKINTQAWEYDAPTRKFVPVEESKVQGLAFSFPSGTLTLAESIPSVTQQLFDVFLQTSIENQKTRDLLETAFKTGLALSANLDFRSLLRDLMALTKEALGAEVSSVMLLDASKSSLFWEWGEADQSGTLRSYSLPVGEGIAGQVAQTGEPIIVTDAQRDSRVAQWVDDATGFQTRSILCVPIRSKGDVIGVIQVLNKLERSFTEQDQELLALIAAEAGVAIENARLYGTLEERVNQRTQELTNTNARLHHTLNDLKDTQTQLIQSEKMAALGKLVAGVAHEINTPLGALASNTDLFNRGFRKLGSSVDEKGKSLMATLDPLLRSNSDACQRISGIVKNLKTFARLDEAEWKSADLRGGMDSTLTLVYHLHKGRIEIIREYEELPLVQCYPGQINQIFMNILVNAIQAIDGPGRIWVRMRREEDIVKIEIQDTGAGIAQDHLPRIFDPGFTTRAVGVGTGLGLAICYKIIQNHSGHIQVISQRGVGTTFTVLLPIQSVNPSSSV